MFNQLTPPEAISPDEEDKFVGAIRVDESTGLMSFLRPLAIRDGCVVAAAMTTTPLSPSHAIVMWEAVIISDCGCMEHSMIVTANLN